MPDEAEIIDPDVPAKKTAVVLEAELALEKIDGLKSKLSAALAAEGEIEIDLTAVEIVDAATLQLLAAFINRSKDSGKSVHWIGFSEVMLDAARTLGLERHLQLNAGKAQ